MVRLAALLWVGVLMLLILFTAPARAGYAQVVPPPALQSVGGVTTIPVGAAANGARYAGGHVMVNATVNVGARAVTVPVAMRVAANAATFAVTRLNPWIAGLSLAASAIPYVLDWFDGTDLEVTSEALVRVRGTPGGPVSAGNGDYWVVSGGQVVRISTVAPPASCDSVAGYAQCTNGQAYGIQIACYNGTRSGCYARSDDPLGPGTPARPATQDDLAPLTQRPINPAVFPALGLPIPVDPVPVINPSTEPVGDVLIGPNGNPAPQLEPSPIRYPDGDPIPIPNTNPQRYTQPWQEVVPSPTPSEPWRVDIRPVTTETTDPTPQPDPTTNPNPNPNPNPVGEFYTDCEKFPGSLGCMPVGTPPPSETIPSRTIDITQQSNPVFGGSGSCPPNLNITVSGRTFTALSMAQPCAWIANFIKPLILLLAAISAVFIVAPRSE